MRDPADGGIKLYVTSRALRLRRENRDLFRKGSYLPMRIAGSRQKHIVAFARTMGRRCAIAVAGRFFLEMGGGRLVPVGEDAWRDTLILLRKGIVSRTFLDVVTRRRIGVDTFDGKLALSAAKVFSHLPVALLIDEDARLCLRRYQRIRGNYDSGPCLVHGTAWNFESGRRACAHSN